MIRDLNCDYEHFRLIWNSESPLMFSWNLVTSHRETENRNSESIIE